MTDSKCPIDHTLSPRRTPLERKDVQFEQDAAGTWHVYDYNIAKQILRDNDQMRQAGFSADVIDTESNPFLENLPVLFAWGDVHKQQRRAIARFFTPQATKVKHKPLMEKYADRLMMKLEAAGQVELGELTMALAADVASDVVGLTNSWLPGRNKRIEQFITQSGKSTTKARDGKVWTRIWSNVVTQWCMGKFYFLDVRPAIVARKRERQEDVISHLIDEAYSGLEILVECVTYGTAGMVTTREFILFAAWHMLENEALKTQYLAAEERERHQILEEILRVDPIVTRLYRHTMESFDMGDVTVPAGGRIALDIETVNVDESLVGEESEKVCPMRPLAAGVLPPVMSFGDGHHRCPGAYIAIQESDVFLTKLLRMPNLKLVSEPTVGFEPLIESRVVRNFVVSVS